MVAESLIAGVSVGLAGAIAHVGPHGIRLVQERLLRERCAATRSLVLTYDDGPGVESTPRLLDLLAAEGARATFFLLGRRARLRPAIVDRIAADGHEIGCHGERHLNAWKAWPWEAVADLEAGYRSLARWITGGALFRPAYGKLSAATWLAIRRRGSRVGWWTIDSGDTFERASSPESTVESVRRAGGGVVLLHDFDRSPDRLDVLLATSRLLLAAARRDGLAVRRLGELLRLESGPRIASHRSPGAGPA
jgi:peptidoglycan/xylan/chitin deacetylase (PgdA/CDA1 family)